MKISLQDWIGKGKTSPKIPVFHHPVHGSAPYPPPNELVIIGPIDFTEFHQPKNIDELFAGLDDIGEVNLPIVDKHRFETHFLSICLSTF
jgi:hypothetical protein